MKFKSSILVLTSLLFLTSCGDNSSSVSNSKNSVVDSTSNKNSISSTDSNKSVSTSKDTTVPFVKKELTVDNIYNDFLSLGSKGNFTIEYSDDLKDIYTEDYVILNSSDVSYFKAKTIYQNGKVGVYKANQSFDDSTGYTSFKLAHLMMGEDSQGYESNEPLTDFHTINKFNYLYNDNYGAKKDDLKLSSDGKQITLDYVTGEDNRMFSVVCLMFANKNNVVSGAVNHISISYDEKNNIVVSFSLKNGDTYTNPSEFASGTIKDINTSYDDEAVEFAKTIDSKIGSQTFSYYSTYSIRNAYLSTNTDLKVNFIDEDKSVDYGTYKLDYNPYKMHIVNSDNSETFIRRTESGAAYIQGINALNQVYDETYYAQNYSTLTWGYKNFDFEGFRYDEDENAYVYLGLNAGITLESITHLGLSAMEFDNVKLYIEDDQISKIVATTSSSYTQVSETEYANISYTFTVDIVDYRAISEPSVYSVLSSTSKIQNVFNKVNDSDNTTFKTVAYEWYQGTDTKALTPVVTTYYTHDVVYKETATKVKDGTSYITKKTGFGQYQVRDEEGNPIGVKLFKVKEDGSVLPRSEIIYGKTLKDYWINISASPLVYELNSNVLSPRSGMTGNKLKDYLPISHTRFEAQEGSMANGGDYTGMSFDLKKDGTEVTDEIESFHYYYGVSLGFNGTYSGTGITEFTYGTSENPITVSESLMNSLKTMSTFKIPTKWSECTSSEIYNQLVLFYQGKKNRYGVDVNVDRDIPYLFDDDLDESWQYYIGQLKNTKDLNINHQVSDIINDGDINNYNAKYEALLKNNADYTYTDSSTNPNFPGPYYYVNGDIVISMTSNTYGGIYFFTAIPDYSK